MTQGSLKAVCTWGFAWSAVALAVGCGRSSSAMDDERSPTAMITSFDGVPIAYDVYGTGSPALVLVHGWSCDRSYWDGQIEPFSQDHGVVTVDLGGHGESGLDREAWTIESFGGDVAAVVDSLGLERVILIGHSMGGDVILEAARRLPGRVDGLVWVDTYKELGSPNPVEQIEAFIAPFRSDFAATTLPFVRSMFPPDADQTLVERVAADMAAAPPEVAVEAMESSFAYGREVTTPVQELGLPVVAINPESPATDTASMTRYGVEVVLMPGVGHFLMMEDPARFNGLLRDVVNRLKR